MLLSHDGMKVVSSWGWTDKGHFSFYDGETKEIQRVAVTDPYKSSYTSLYNGEKGYFAARHAYEERGRSLITVHHFDRPKYVFASCDVTTSAKFSGDNSVWQHVPQYFRHYIQGSGADKGQESPYWLIHIDGSGTSATLNRMSWFSIDEYDYGYQQPRYPIFIKENDEILIPIQRNDHPVRLDGAAMDFRGKIQLAGRGGNPEIQQAKMRSE